MSDLNIRKTAVLLGVQIFGVLVLGELLASGVLFTLIGVVTPERLNRDVWTLLFAVVILKVLLQGYLIFLLAYNWTSNRYLIRGHHLVMRHRLLAQDEKLYELSNLQNIHVHQSWLGRLFSFGTLELKFAMPGQVFTILLSDVHDPRRYGRMMERFFAPPGVGNEQPAFQHPMSIMQPSTDQDDLGHFSGHIEHQA